MAKNREHLILEFNGLPGSGKTTVSERFKELYGEELDIDRKFNCYDSGKSGWRCYLSFIVKGDLIQLFNLVRYSLSLKRPGLFMHILRSVYIFSISYRRFVEQKKEKWMISDQGIVQAVISMCYPQEFKGGKLPEKILKRMFSKYNIVVVNCISDTEISTERILSRKKQTKGRLDKLDEAQLRKALEIQENSFECVRGILNRINVKQIDIDMKCTSEENAEKIYRELKGE